MKMKINIKVKILICFIFTLLFSNTASALDIFNFTNNSNDVLLEGMGHFFNTDGTTANASSAFTLMIKVIIESILLPSGMGGIIYAVIALTTSQAMTGKVALKNIGYSYPGKVLLCVTMLVPGFNGVPLIIILLYYCFTFSNALGTAVGNVAIDNAPKNSIMTNKYADDSLYPLLSKMVNANRCILESQNYIDKLDEQGTLNSFLAVVSSKNIKPNFTTTTGTVVDGNDVTHLMISYGDKSGAFVLGRNLCSTIDYEITSKSNNIDLNENIIDSVNAPKLQVIKQDFNQIHEQQLIALNQKALQLAQYQMSPGFNIDTYKTMFADATNSYANALTDEGNKLSQQFINNNNYSQIMKMGPAMYGALPSSMGIVQGEIQQEKDTLPTTSGVGINNVGLKDTGLGPVVIGAINSSDNINNTVMGELMPSTAITKGDVGQTDSNDSIFMRLAVGPILDLVNFRDIVSTTDFYSNPIFTEQQEGYKILKSIGGIEARFVTLGIVTLPIPGSSVAVNWIGSTFITPLVMGLWIPAILLTFLIPLMPVVMWLGVITGWILGLINSMCTVTVALITLVYPDPQGFVGRSGQIYLVFLEEIARIPFSVIGLFAGWSLLPITHYFIALNFTAIFNTKLTGFEGLITGVVEIVLYGLVSYANTKACLALSSKLPDVMLSLLGRTSQLMSSSVSDISNSVDKASGAVATGVTAITAGARAGISNMNRMGKEKNKNNAVDDRTRLNLRRKK
ncbi:hypothetical protein JK211_14470 [Tatumella sp. JGM130]|uniref:hypothetical protein n=1 Tax=Tatumella sp. JGM130 TaxID=2799797 RepID=UPI001BAF5AB6|nr:hypothetical protein [Tatumella sp. JGM130]MBS0895219.1 hypothetical protein [Tatumella sp. JGM130]